MHLRVMEVLAAEKEPQKVQTQALVLVYQAKVSLAAGAVTQLISIHPVVVAVLVEVVHITQVALLVVAEMAHHPQLLAPQ